MIQFKAKPNIEKYMIAGMNLEIFLIVQKKGKVLDYNKSWRLSDEGFVIRMEAIYDLEFADGKRFKSGVIKIKLQYTRILQSILLLILIFENSFCCAFLNIYTGLY